MNRSDDQRPKQRLFLLAEPFPSARIDRWDNRSPSRRILRGNRYACVYNCGRPIWRVLAAVAAGAVGAAALALLLIAFEAGLGLSAVSPWSDSGVSASTFKTGTGIYLVIVAVMSSAVGGYLAARLRTKWSEIHTHEVFFRDTAHGFLAWAFATLLSATALSSATAYLANGTAAAVGGAALQATGPLIQGTSTSTSSSVRAPRRSLRRHPRPTPRRRTIKIPINEGGSSALVDVRLS